MKYALTNKGEKYELIDKADMKKVKYKDICNIFRGRSMKGNFTMFQCSIFYERKFHYVSMKGNF